MKSKYVVLLIGTNSTIERPNNARAQLAEQVAAGIVAVVDETHTQLPAARILILPSGMSIEKSSKDRGVNAELRNLCALSPYVQCLDLSSLLLRAGELDLTLYTIRRSSEICIRTQWGDGRWLLRWRSSSVDNGSAAIIVRGFDRTIPIWKSAVALNIVMELQSAERLCGLHRRASSSV